MHPSIIKSDGFSKNKTKQNKMHCLEMQGKYNFKSRHPKIAHTENACLTVYGIEQALATFSLLN